MPRPHPLPRTGRALPVLAAGLLALTLGGATVAAAPSAGAGGPSGEPPGPVHGPPRYRPATGFSWPLAGAPPVLRPFRAPSTPYGPGHCGVDLGGHVGDTVLAAADGLVVYAGVLAGRGVVSIEYGERLRSTYEPVRPLVTVGTLVHRGQQIGLLDPGHPGCPLPPPPPGASTAAGSAACLHWGLRRRLDYLNPAWPESTRVHLLPWIEPPP